MESATAHPATVSGGPPLRAEDVDAFYGQAQALHGVSVSVSPTGVTCLLGRNGVGKTTLLRTLLGLLPVGRGTISLGVQDLTRTSAHQRAALGLRLVPQEQSAFPGLTVRDHLELGAHSAPRQTRRDRSALDEVYALFPFLADRLRQPAQTLSGGERRMLAIGQALAGRPRFLLMDEPTEGVQPNVVTRIAEAISTIGQHCGVLLVEQNLDVALQVGQSCYVLEKGSVVASGPLADLSADGVLDRYLRL